LSILSVGWPIDGYLVTYRAGVNLANATLLKLAERYNIVAAKDCCAYPAQSSS
jgi:4-hydroxy-tetrahydrodipicolinate synthase